MKPLLCRALWLSCTLFLLGIFPTHGQVIITEFMASNGATLADEDGDFSDWIEIQNTSGSTVNLSGWALTDDEDDLQKWRFPAVSLPAKGFLVVFASSKNRRVVGQPLHTSFNLGAGGEYLALVKADGVTIATEYSPTYPEQYRDISYGLAQNVTTNRFLLPSANARTLIPANGDLNTSWTATGFNDSSWTAGSTGIGYETAVPGMAVKNVKANIQVGHITTAEQVLATPGQQSSVVSQTSPYIDFFGTGGAGNYGNNVVFPGHTAGVDFEDFVVEVTGTVTIPAAGNWSFGVNSDDGFSLTVGSFSSSFPDPRGPSDTIAVFNFPAAGDYPLRLVFYERGGGAGLEMFARQGNFTFWDGEFRLVGDTANGGLAIRSIPVGGGGGGTAGFRSLIGTDVQTAMNNMRASAYTRIPFQIANRASIESLTMRMKYDDGFVAYLNGQEVARRNAPASPLWNSTATNSRPNNLALTYEDINISDNLSALVDGNNLLAIHGLNIAANDTDFLILPELAEYKFLGDTNNFFDVPTPGTINAQGFLAYVADTKFSHDRGFHDVPFDLVISTETTGATIRYTTNGAPPTATTGFVYTGPLRIAGTTVLRAAAFKDGFQSTNPDTQTYLFLDDVIQQSPTGAAPPGWPSSWGANEVNYGMDPDIVNNPAYSGRIKDDLKSLPSFSIVMKLDDLFNPSTGIIANPGQDGREWERPTSVELINSDGTPGFQIDAGIRIRGGFSRSTGNPKHAFRLFFRSDYGESKLVYPLFGDEGTDTFDKIDLRTFQNYSWSFQGDGNGVFLRDQFSRDTQLAMGHPAERGNFYHLYINGQYWGIFNTCERPEAAYGETYLGGDSDDYDVVKVEAGPYTINATDGNLVAWRQLYDLAEIGFASNEAYMRVQGRNVNGTINPAYTNYVDIPNLIDYMLVIFYGGNLDAPISNFLGNTAPNNWYGIRNRVNGDGFRFVAHDSEHTLLPWDVNVNRTGPFAAGDPNNGGFSRSNPQRTFQQLTANVEFRMVLADHIHRHFFNGGVFTVQSALDRFNKRKNQIDAAVTAESARWGDSKRATPFTRVDWQNAINNVTANFINPRSAIVLNQLRQKGWYPNIATPVFNQFGGVVTNGFNLTITGAPGVIYYTLDGSDPRLMGGGVSSSALTYSGAIPLTESAHVKARALSGGVWTALNEATFYIRQNFNNLVVSEIMYHPADEGDIDGDEFEFMELKNLDNVEIELSGIQFTNGITYTFPLGKRLGPGQFVVLVNRVDGFTNRYPTVAFDGVYEGQLSNSGERLTAIHASGETLFSFEYSDAAPWPVAADGQGFSLVPLNANLKLDPTVQANWRASGVLNGTPGADDIVAGLKPIWISEVLTHTDLPDVDFIELYNPNPTSVNIGGWFLTDNRVEPKKYRIPDGTSLEAGAYRVFTEDDFNANPGVPPNFTLSSHGEEVFLFSADAAGNLTGYSDGFSFDAAANGTTFGRYVNSAGEVQYPAQSAATPGQPNAGPRVGPIVINEIQYAPAVGQDEFIELKNTVGFEIALFNPQHQTNTWRIAGASFSFPMNTTIPANGLAVISGLEPGVFRAKYGVPANVAVFGPWNGNLQDGGERVAIEWPDNTDYETNGAVVTEFVPYVAMDIVRYDQLSPWPTNAGSIERKVATTYGNDPANWRSSGGQSSPGLENDGNRPPQVAAGPDQDLAVLSLPTTTSLSGQATDDGLPDPPAALTYQWTQISGPAQAGFSSTNVLTPSLNIPTIGTYVFRLTATDGLSSVADEVQVVVRPVSSALTLLSRGAVWKYLDNGSNQGTTWRGTNFNDSAWASGAAQLGYGDDDESTDVSYGPEQFNKYITTYFRTTFTVQNPSAIASLTVKFLRDDGGVVYLNGQEIFRSNMPEGTINFNTLAAGIAGNADETTYFETNVPTILLFPGVNVLAVEVHQGTVDSSDLSFDLELEATANPVNNPPTVNAGPDISIAGGETAVLNGSVVDDGLPAHIGATTIEWVKASGPGDVTFTNDTTAVTAATFSANGEYLLRLYANDGTGEVFDEVIVTVGGDPYITWQNEHFTPEELQNPAISGDDADPDGDRMTNREEYIAGNDPRDSDSYLGLVIRSGGSNPGVVFRYYAVPGKSYTIQYRESLTTGDWQKLFDIDAEDSGGPTETSDNNADVPVRYYRIVTPQQP